MAEQKDQAKRAQILTTVEAEGIGFVNLEFTDVVGMAKCVTIPVEQLPDCLIHGKWFDGSAIEGFARVAESDMYLYPDLDTFAILPGKIRPGEITHAFFSEPDDQHLDLSTDLAATVRRQMVKALQQMGIRIEASHHEVAAGQHELDFETADALHIADGLMTAKYVLKGIAAQHDLYATFLPKPFFGVNGSGMHTHQQLINSSTGQNVFVDEHGEYGLSDIGRYFIAGQLAHAHSMCAILAPLVNSYKRLVRGFEAPVFINWGRVNREALIRVPRPGIDRQLSARIELRCPDPSSNPYLALAVMLRAGLDGIQRKLPLPPAMDESLFLRDEEEGQRHHTKLLPATLGEALDGLREDSLIRETLGDSIYEGFIEAKSIEWIEYRKQVHPWELERYLPVF
jgi:glutamine synthetase